MSQVRADGFSTHRKCDQRSDTEKWQTLGLYTEEIRGDSQVQVCKGMQGR